jgi:hypothetical protein
MMSTLRQALEDSSCFPFSLSLACAALLSAVYWRTHTAALVQAVPKNDPNSIWSIGVTDNSGDGFSLGAADALTYEVSPNAKSADWRERQEAGANIYKIRFQLPAAPASAPVLAIDGFFMGLGPRGLIISVNGKRGFFRVPEGRGHRRS